MVLFVKTFAESKISLLYELENGQQYEIKCIQSLLFNNEVRALVVAVQQPLAECTAIFTMCIV